MVAAMDWPLKPLRRARAVDGRKVGQPSWWRAGAGAWGCLQSHIQIIEQASMDGLRSVLILEDDVTFCDDFSTRLAPFLDRVPDDWHQIYLGGQHLCQRKSPPIRINEEVIRPFNVNRTHAYALHQRFYRPAYEYLTDYATHARAPGRHIDHRYGALHETGRFNIYAPTRWLAGQQESLSNISGHQERTRFWNGHRVQADPTPFVAVVGLHRSGSSCVAGVLHHLGIFMGRRLGGYEASGGFEDPALAAICERAFPFPTTSARVAEREIAEALKAHVNELISLASRMRRPAGGKYPHLAAMGPQLRGAAGDRLRVLNVERPLEDSIASLVKRSNDSQGWLRISREEAARVQHWLWDHKRRFLREVGHHTVHYYDLVAEPRAEIARIAEWLRLSPHPDQLAAAEAHVAAAPVVQ
jgi:hypothetical protein